MDKSYQICDILLQNARIRSGKSNSRIFDSLDGRKKFRALVMRCYCMEWVQSIYSWSGWCHCHPIISKCNYSVHQQSSGSNPVGDFSLIMYYYYTWDTVYSPTTGSQCYYRGFLLLCVFELLFVHCQLWWTTVSRLTGVSQFSSSAHSRRELWGWVRQAFMGRMSFLSCN